MQYKNNNDQTTPSTPWTVKRSFSSEVAVALGGDLDAVAEAIVIRQIEYWLDRCQGVIYQGRKWIYNSLKSWSEQFFYISPSETRRALERLREKSVLLSEPLAGVLNRANIYNRTLYYTINYEELNKLLRKAQSRMPSHLSNQTNGFVEPTNPFANEDKTDQTTTTSNYYKPIPPTQREKREREKNKTSQEQVNYPQRDRQPDLEQLNQANNPATGQQSKAFEQDNLTAKRERLSLSQSTLKLDNHIVNKVSRQPVKAKAPWKTDSELQQFRAALVQALPIVANAKSPEALANKIISQLRQGESHSYWDDFKAENPIGWSLKPEWEIMPGEPYPMFVQYLMNKLSEPHDSR
ncbi:MAG: hypothetical protein AB4372_19690, partial [Xenococcus sp. (in: cyanobacteria)]